MFLSYILILCYFNSTSKIFFYFYSNFSFSFIFNLTLQIYDMRKELVKTPSVYLGGHCSKFTGEFGYSCQQLQYSWNGTSGESTKVWRKSRSTYPLFTFVAHCWLFRKRILCLLLQSIVDCLRMCSCSLCDLAAKYDNIPSGGQISLLTHLLKFLAMITTKFRTMDDIGEIIRVVKFATTASSRAGEECVVS